MRTVLPAKEGSAACAAAARQLPTRQATSLPIFIAYSLPSRDHLEELRAVAAELAGADAGDLRHLGEIAWPRRRHRNQRRIMEDDVGRHMMLVRERQPQLFQEFQEAGIGDTELDGGSGRAAARQPPLGA